MKPIKLSLNSNILEQEEAAIRFGKNGIMHPELKNEKGFRRTGINLPYTTYLGKIETSTDPIVFCTNGSSSAIGYLNMETEVFTPIIDDSALGFKLNLDPNSFILGESRRNSINELEIAWVEVGGSNPPRFYVEGKSLNSPNDLLLFPINPSPTISISSGAVGSLRQGAYLVAVRYLEDSGAPTNFFTSEGPIYTYIQGVPTSPDIRTSQGIRVNIKFPTGLRFKRYQIALISVVNGVTETSLLPPRAITNQEDITITGNEVFEDITLEELLIPPADYSNAQKIGQLNDVLYLGDLEENKDENYQSIFNNLKIKWAVVSKDVDSEELKSGEFKTFKPGEVYAIYGRFVWKSGKTSKAFHIPGIDNGLTSEPVTTLDNGVGGSVQIPAMVNSDTISNLPNSITGYTGTWINDGEKYPNREGFEDLVGKPVRHHVMPSFRRLEDILNSQDLYIGTMPVLGISVDMDTVPSNIKPSIERIELFYAERSYSNSLLPSQGYLYKYAEGPGGVDGQLLSSYINTGVNYSTQVTTLNGPLCKMNAFMSPEQMLDKPILDIKAIRVIKNLQIGRNLDYKIVNEYVGFFSMVADLDYTDRNNSNYLGVPGNSTIGVAENKYISVGENADRRNNYKGQNHLSLIANTYPGALGITNPAVLPPYSPTFKEQISIVELVTPKRDLYNSFYMQRLVKVGGAKVTIEGGVYNFGGDLFLGKFTTVTHGVFSNGDLEWGGGDQYAPDKGTRVRRTVNLITSKNLEQRFEDLSNPNDRFWKTGENLEDARRDANLNTLNLPLQNNIGNIYLNGVEPLDPNVIKNTVHPYRITRSQYTSREGTSTSWTRFNPLDYFETIKNKGKIQNISTIGDNLIIHHEHAITRTRDKAKLKTDILDITLGSGDIFEIPPIESRSSKIGTAGLSHPLHAESTDLGYIFVDVLERVIYLVEPEGMSPLNGDMDNFLKAWLSGLTGNPIRGSGVAIGYDRDTFRLFLTANNGNKSFTLSYNLEETKRGWAFFHDFFPQGYIHTRKGLLNIKSPRVYKHNEGKRGVYHTSEVKPFFFDAVFTSTGDDFILNAVEWRTIVEEFDENLYMMNEIHEDSFDYITIWNSEMCTGRIPVDKHFKNIMNKNSRRPLSSWSFNEFRNRAKQDERFLSDIFNNFEVIDSKLDNFRPYYKRDRIAGDFVIVRFEYSNKLDRDIKVLDVSIDASEFIR